MVAPAPCVVRRRASSFGKEEPSLARPHFAGLPRLRYGIISPPLALGEGGVEVRPVRVRPFLVSIRAPAAPAPHPSYSSFSISRHAYPTHNHRLCLRYSPPTHPIFHISYPLRRPSRRPLCRTPPFRLVVRRLSPTAPPWPIHTHAHTPFLPISRPCNHAAAVATSSTSRRRSFLLATSFL